ncbi:hypothetical protein FACS1894159_11220 [Bacteroidia bacterium]|nr:hypothetical protein FACS1894159_11220 [Bacteroidia bacterium]
MSESEEPGARRGDTSVAGRHYVSTDSAVDDCLELAFGSDSRCYLIDLSCDSVVYYTYDQRTYPLVQLYEIEDSATLAFTSRIEGDTLTLCRVEQGAELWRRTLVAMKYLP